MVGLVIVSHSKALADGLTGLVRQVTTTEIPLASAAGIGEMRQEFGTDAVEIMDAIQSVYSEDGVVVLMDLGSAVLSAKMALELLPPEMQAKNPAVRRASGGRMHCRGSPGWLEQRPGDGLPRGQLSPDPQARAA